MTGLQTIGGDLRIGHIDYEGNPSLINLTGLEGLNSIGGDLRIEINDSLISLVGLENLNSIWGDLRIGGNDALTSLTGLDNIDAGSISGLFITYNFALSTCKVQSVCDYLASPGGTIEIYGNTPGCNSQEEVEEACEMSVNELNFLNKLSIYPNPFSNTITIEFDLKQPEIVTITIYNHLGEKVETIKGRKSVGQQKIEWNCTEISAGIYFCVLKTNEEIQTIKIIKH